MKNKHAAYTTIDGVSVVGFVSKDGFEYAGDSGCRIPAGLYQPGQVGPLFLSLDLDRFGEDLTEFKAEIEEAGFVFEQS